MIKEHSCAVFISTTQDYGNDAWYQEYQAQIGTPLNSMYQGQGVYWRDYSNGVSIVNPASRGTFTVNLNAAFQYVDLYGNRRWSNSHNAASFWPGAVDTVVTTPHGSRAGGFWNDAACSSTGLS